MHCAIYFVAIGSIPVYVLQGSVL